MWTQISLAQKAGWRSNTRCLASLGFTDTIMKITIQGRMWLKMANKKLFLYISNTYEGGGPEDSPWTWAAAKQGYHTGQHNAYTAMREMKSYYKSCFFLLGSMNEPTCGTFTWSAKPGPNRSHCFSIFAMRVSINEELALASAWASVSSLMQSWHTVSLSYTATEIQCQMKVDVEPFMCM